MSASCIFCKIIQRQIPSHKLLETDLSYVFLDINPLNRGHFLVIPKEHSQFMHQLSDESLADLLPTAKKVFYELADKKVAKALGPPAAYNILQNNGRIANQEVDHVHFHIIPKDDVGGLGIKWTTTKPTQQDLEALAGEITSRM
jgi:diadenosine tetraphosphate (Ap4A) HIT family hydrolase